MDPMFSATFHMKNRSFKPQTKEYFIMGLIEQDQIEITKSDRIDIWCC